MKAPHAKDARKQVVGQHVPRRAIGGDAPVLQQDQPRAMQRRKAEVVDGRDDGAAFGGKGGKDRVVYIGAAARRPARPDPA